MSAFLGRTDINEFQGALLHPFSVSATKKIVFSKGNLQFSRRGSHVTMDSDNVRGTWRFAEHQYDAVGGATTGLPSEDPANSKYNPRGVSGNVYYDDNGVLTKCDNRWFYDENYEGWFDNFAYATSGYYAGKPIYRPYDYDPTNNKENFLDTPPNGGLGLSDWGIYNAISNGGNTPNCWRTLTYEEWKYLVVYRSNAPTLISTGKIHLTSPTPDGVEYIYGVILLPDNWNGAPEGCTFNTFTEWAYFTGAGGTSTDPTNPNLAGYSVTSPSDMYTLNVYTEAQWALMESYGAVFLPSAGTMSLSDSYKYEGEVGRICMAVGNATSSNYSVSSGSDYLGNPLPTHTHGFFFPNNSLKHNVYSSYTDSTKVMRQVRLVMDVEDLKNPVLDTMTLKGENSNAILKTDGTNLFVSFDRGTTWNTVQLS